VLNKQFFLPVYIILGLIILSFTNKSSGLDQDVFRYTNQFRKSKGLSALAMRDDLNEVARKHSENMASGKVAFGHDGFQQRQAKVRQIIKPWHSMAENVAYGVSTGKDVVSIWKKSSGHRANMLGNYTYIGIGTASDRQGRIYYTQIFVR